MLSAINNQKIDVSIKMIITYVTDVDASHVISALEAIKLDHDDAALIAQLSNSLKQMGISQGAVLNYAPYVALLVSEDLFNDD